MIARLRQAGPQQLQQRSFSTCRLTLSWYPSTDIGYQLQLEVGGWRLEVGGWGLLSWGMGTAYFGQVMLHPIYGVWGRHG